MIGVDHIQKFIKLAAVFILMEVCQAARKRNVNAWYIFSTICHLSFLFQILAQIYAITTLSLDIPEIHTFEFVC